MSNASPYEHDGLAPDARFFSSYRPFFSRPKSRVRAGGFSLQMLMTPLTGHPACVFSAALADAIMEETPPRGVVDDGTMDEENRASGEGLRLRRRRRRKLWFQVRGLGEGLATGELPVQGLIKSRRRRKRRGAFVGWRVDFQASTSCRQLAGQLGWRTDLHQLNDKRPILFSRSLSLFTLRLIPVSRDRLAIDSMTSPPARIGSFHCAVRRKDIAARNLPSQVEEPSLHVSSLQAAVGGGGGWE